MGRKSQLSYWLINAAAVMSWGEIDLASFFNMTTPWQTDDIINFPQNIFDSLSKDIDSFGTHAFGSLHLSAALEMILIFPNWILSHAQKMLVYVVVHNISTQ